VDLAPHYPLGGSYGREIRVLPAVPALRRLNYAATEPSRFRRTRQSLGGTADAHYAQDYRFWEMREYARDMDRNDVLVGQMFDRAIENILGPGLKLHPTTGDKALDLELWERWEEWRTTPKLCDFAGKRPFSELERLGLRHRMVDGDAFAIVRPGDEAPCLQFLEAERCTSADNLSDDIVHGIEVDPMTDAVIAYHFTKGRPGIRKQHTRQSPLASSRDQLIRVPALDRDGNSNVLHLFKPKRLTQTRGVTDLAPCFDMVGMLEDTNLARLVQQQMVSCVGAFITREHDYQLGSRETQDNLDGTQNTLEELAPGMVVRLRTGEKLESFNPNVPNPEFFHHVRLLIRMIGGNVGMPLELVLLDTTDTTFHGYRGVLQQARKGFEVTQKRYPEQLHTPIYHACLRQWAPELGIRTKKLQRKLKSHYWQAPGWPYVDPKTEAEADRIRLKNLLTSPRRLAMEHGADWDDIKKEAVEDWGTAIEDACVEAERLNKKFKNLGSDITWREVLNLDNPTGNTKAVKEPLQDPNKPDPDEVLAIQQQQADTAEKAANEGPPPRPAGSQPANAQRAK
jgi:lambda family phage portal protein